MATVWSFILSLVALFVSFCGWVSLKMRNLYKKENITRAQRFFEEGEAFFKKNNYKDAKWNYEIVSEFYSTPHTPWLELSREKEWMCRAYLNDWAPSKGSLEADVRRMQPNLYAKYKDNLDQITPVPQTKKSKKSKKT